MRGYRMRPCCETTYMQEHLHYCPLRGVVARHSQPCDMTADGWCAAHSTGSHAARCQPGRPDHPRGETTARPTPDTEESAMVESSESPAVGRG